MSRPRRRDYPPSRVRKLILLCCCLNVEFVKGRGDDNGYIKSLKQLVHFYNTRDVYPFPVQSGECPAGTVEKVTCWPVPEVTANEDMTVGKLGLTDAEENQIVAFLQTLTDGFTTAFPDIGTYTGTCMSGGTAATQGNSTIISAIKLRELMNQR